MKKEKNCWTCRYNIDGVDKLTDDTFIVCKKVGKAIPIDMIRGHSLFSCKFYEDKVK